MGIVVEETVEERTFLAAVQKVMKQCGLSDPGTVVSPDANTSRAMEAVVDALREIWFFAAWDFKNTWMKVQMEADLMWYELPTNWGEPAVDHLGENRTLYPLKYTPYETLVDRYPYVRNIPAPYVGLTLATQMAADAARDDYHGAPRQWTIWGGYLGLFPIPTAEYIAGDGGYLVGTYRKAFTEPVADADSIYISGDLYHVQHSLALGLFKEMMEWDDAYATLGRARGQLARAAAANARQYRTEGVLMPEE